MSIYVSCYITFTAAPAAGADFDRKLYEKMKPPPRPWTRRRYAGFVRISASVAMNEDLSPPALDLEWLQPYLCKMGLILRNKS